MCTDPRGTSIQTKEMVNPIPRIDCRRSSHTSNGTRSLPSRALCLSPVHPATEVRREQNKDTTLTVSEVKRSGTIQKPQLFPDSFHIHSGSSSSGVKSCVPKIRNGTHSQDRQSFAPELRQTLSLLIVSPTRVHQLRAGYARLLRWQSGENAAVLPIPVRNALRKLARGRKCGKFRPPLR